MCILMECLTSSYSFICDASLRHSFLFVQFCSLQQRELEISSWHSVLILALYQISNKLPAWSIKLLLHLTLLCPIAELQSKLTFSLGAPAEWHVTVGVWFRWKPLGSDLKVFPKVTSESFASGRRKSSQYHLMFPLHSLMLMSEYSFWLGT